MRTPAGGAARRPRTLARTSALTPRLTPAGSAVAYAAMVLALLGWALGSVAMTVVAAGATAALLAGALATIGVPRLDVSRAIEPARVERGMRAFGLVSVRNGGRRPSPGCIAVEVIATERPRTERTERTVHVAIPPLRAGRSVAVPYEIPTERRGALVVGPLSITRRDPFGLWLARRPVGDTVTLLVQPRVHAIDPRRGGKARHLDGPVSDTATQGVLTFHSLREYAPGDDIRRVHWKSTARTGTLMVREHVDTSLPSAVVVLDTRASCYPGDLFEEAVDVVASVVAASQSRGFPVRLVTSDGRSFVVRTGQHGQDLHDFLTTVEPEPTGDLQRAAIGVLRGREHDAITVVAGSVVAEDLAAVTSMTRGFASSALVTVRAPSDPPAPRWIGGVHLDGASAAVAVGPWRIVKPNRTTVGPAE